MAVTPEGMLSFPLAELRDLVAACATFQAWVGEPGDAAAAALRVEFLSENDTGDNTADAELRPFAIVGWSDNFEATRDSEPPRYDHAGSLELAFEDIPRPVAGDSTESELFLTFANAIGGIMAELETKTGRNSLLLVNAFRKLVGPSRPSLKARNGGELDIIGILFEIDWAER